MKKPIMLPAIVVALSTLFAGIDRARADFAQSMGTGASYASRGMTGMAVASYDEAFKQAQNDEQRAEAQLAAAKNTQIRYGKPDPATDGNLKIAAYQKVLGLPGAPSKFKADAHLGIAETQAQLQKFDAALETLKKVLEMADAPSEQKFKAQLWRGEVLLEAKRYADARTALAVAATWPETKPEQKLTAHQAIARSHFRQINLTDGRAEIAKINALPGLTDQQRADIHIQNGMMLAEAGDHKAARDEYAKVAVLADATAQNNIIARYRIGESYFTEKNYEKAREAWTQAVEMRGSATFAADIWRSIGVAYIAEKNYEKAREAFQKWLALPNLDFQGKVLAWQHIADSYVQEKKYAEAREALGNISKLAPANATFWDKLQFKLRQQLDIADVYRAEGDFTKAGETYAAILTDVPVGGAVEPPFYYEARTQVQKAADALAEDKVSMAAAYTVYEALEKAYPYAKQDAEAFIGMGDILLAQGKPTEAKAKYQKALELRKTYDEGKIAQEKIRKIEAQEKPAIAQ